MENTYISNLLKNLKQEDYEKFLVSNQSKDFWSKSFKNELQVGWEQFRTEFEKALNEINYDKEDVLESLLYLKYKLVSNGKVNIISFGGLFNKENSFKEVLEGAKFESNFNKLKQNQDGDDSIIKAIKSYFGIGEERNEEKGKNELISESKKGNKLAEGLICLNGWEENKKDEQKAIECLSSVYFSDEHFTKGETSYAVYLMAKMFEKGEGIEKNEKKARILLELASTKNNALAQYEIGKKYENGEKDYEKDLMKAIENIEKAARGGYSIAFYELAKFYEKGVGQDFPVDLDTALFLYERASQMGISAASIKIAFLYLDGSDGVEKNVPKAISLLTLASNKGISEATDKLKQLNEEGIKIVDYLEEGVKKCILEGKCTRVATDKSYEEQPYFDCLTCGIKDGKGVCQTCKDVCHKGHEFGEMKFGGFFCDCVDNFKDCIYQPEPEIEDTTGKHFENLFGENIISKEKDIKPTQETLNDLVVGIYFSAHWCGPCRKFSPKLVSLYEEINKDGKKMEIVFVSSDQSSEKMFDYMNEVKMPWLALPFDSPNVKELKKKFKVNGIPHLVILNKKGKKVSEDGYGDLLSLGNKVFEEKWSK